MSFIRRHSWWIYILFFGCAQLTAGILSVLLLKLHPELSYGQIMAPTLFAANLLGAILFFCHRPSSITWQTTLSGFRGQNGRRSGLVFLLALPVILLVNLGQEIFFPELPDWVGEENMKSIMFNPFGLLTVAVLGPLTEELLFRGGVQTDLTLHHSNQGWFVPIAFSAFIFALIHMNPAQMPAAFTLGLLLGFAYWWTDSLVASVAIHVFNNSFACLISILSPNDDSLIHFLGGPTSAGIAAIVCLFWLYLAFRAVQKEGLRKG